MDRTLTLRCGRRLSWHEVGPESGMPVLALHGLPGSREQRYPDEGLAGRLGARMIHVERPGFGLSDAQPGRQLRDWPRDIEQLADHLRLDRFCIAGVSGGGPFALACAALLPRRVSRLALVSSVGPPGSMERQMRVLTPTRVAFGLARHHPAMLAPLLSLMACLAVRYPGPYIELVARGLGGEDQVILADEPVRRMLMRDVREAFRHGPDAMLTDVALIASDWNIPFADIRATCALWHGQRDRMIPASASIRLAEKIPGSRLTLLSTAGHFFVLRQWPEILAWLIG